MNMDELLKTALAPMDVPKQRLNNQVLLAIKERRNMMNKKRIPVVALVAVCTLIFGSITAVATHRYLNPSEVATEVKDNALKNAFLGEDAVLVNETQESGGYRVTLMGSVAGRNISDYLATDNDGTLQDNMIYTIVAIERADGTPMPNTSSDDYGKEPFYVSHYIRGLNPAEYSLMSMGGGYSAIVRDGIEYRILEMDNIEMFADRGIYVGVSKGAFYDRDAYLYDESTGTMRRNESYGGVNALFTLPVDESKADPKSADEYLEKLHTSWNTPTKSVPMEESAFELEVRAFMDMLTAENLDEYAEPVESTRTTCTPDENGYASFSYELKNGSAGSGGLFVTPEMETGKYQIGGCSYSDSGLKSLHIDVFVLNEDGTVTAVIYQPKGE